MPLRYPFIERRREVGKFNENQNISSDISCTAGQMPRLLGLAQASNVFKEIKFEALKSSQQW